MIKISQKILNLLNESEGHMTAEQIFDACKKKGIKTSFASVYRALTELLQEGKISEISIADGSDYYDKTIYAHNHMKCVKCGKIKDIDIPNIDSLIKESLKDQFVSYNLIVNYICDECNSGGK